MLWLLWYETLIRLLSASVDIYVICLLLAKEDIPPSVYRLVGVAEQLDNYSKSDVAADIIEVAARFRSIASDNRLGRPRTQNTNLQKAALSRFKKPAPGLSKGKTLMAEINAAKFDAGKIKVTAGLYVLSKNKSSVRAEIMKKVMLFYEDRGNTETVPWQVPQVYFSLKFDETTMIYDALGDVLVDAQAFHQKSFPLAQPIQRFVTILRRVDTMQWCHFVRNNVDFYAHESASKCYRLPDRMVTDGNPNHYEVATFVIQLNTGTIAEFFEKFKDHGYLTKSTVAEKQLEIRLVCEEDRIVSTTGFCAFTTDFDLM